jgi:hypothetical protein
MPANQGRRLHDDQSAAPIEEVCQHDQADPDCGIDSPRLYPAFDVQRQLTAQEEILGAEGTRFIAATMA